jgi:ATP-dependent Lhr-like helicase
MDSDDTLEALVIGRRTYEEDLEPVDVPEKPYDVLVNQIAGCLMKNRRLYFQDLHEKFRKAYPFRNIDLKEIERIAGYMHNRFPRFAWVDFEDRLLIKPRISKALFEYFFENLSMIPDEKHYLVVEQKSETAIGILDEAFVAEHGKPGVKFIIRGSPWQILSVYKDKIYVKPVKDPTGSIPSWFGEEIPVPFEVAQEVGAIREFVELEIKKESDPVEVARRLSKIYPADEKTIFAAISESVESSKKGYLVPTHRRITFEEWEDFIILQSNFGSLTNRALGFFLAQVISKREGYSVSIQHDPYRIFIQTMGEVKIKTLKSILHDFGEMSTKSIQDTLTEACIKTGLFKRRIIHVAKRFGALRKIVDFSNISLQNLVKSFENTLIYEEAFKEVFLKDLDLRNLIKVSEAIQKGEIELVEIETIGEPSPIASVGIERVSMKTDLIPPEKMKRILLESAKARLLDETRTFICTSCWDYIEMIKIKDLPLKPACPKCNSKKLGLLRIGEDKAYAFLEKIGEKMKGSVLIQSKRAFESSKLIAKYGKPAAVAQVGKGLKMKDIKEILNKESILTSSLFELIIESERKALKRRFL